MNDGGDAGVDDREAGTLVVDHVQVRAVGGDGGAGGGGADLDDGGQRVGGGVETEDDTLAVGGAGDVEALAVGPHDGRVELGFDPDPLDHLGRGHVDDGDGAGPAVDDVSRAAVGAEGEAGDHGPGVDDRGDLAGGGVDDPQLAVLAGDEGVHGGGARGGPDQHWLLGHHPGGQHRQRDSGRHQGSQSPSAEPTLAARGGHKPHGSILTMAPASRAPGTGERFRSAGRT
nr:hypothetical protein [Kutzneria sp. 744]